jgi:uncharacterized protein YqkB
MLNKTFHLLLLLLIPILGFSQANSQYPDSGNKIRLGFQTTADGLIWRDTQPNVGVYQPINNKAAWVVLDTVNNKLYHYKNSAWTLVGGDTTSLSNRIDLRLEIADTTDMLSPYWRSGRFSGVLPVANGGTNLTTLGGAGRVPFASSTTQLTTNANFKYESDILYIPSAIFNGTSNYGYTFASRNVSASGGVGIFFRGEQGSEPNLPTTFGYPYINIGAVENKVNAIQSIGFGFNNGTGGYISPAEIGYLTKSLSGYTNGDLVFATRESTNNVAPAEKMRITSDGKVGIGTTSPSQKLSIVGNITSGTDPDIASPLGIAYTLMLNKSSQTYFIMNTASETAVHSPVFLPIRSRGTLSSPTVVSSGDRLFLFGALGYGNTGYDTEATGMLIETDAAAISGSNHIPTRISFIGNNTSGVGITYMTFKSSGNVGIGTAAPGSRLVVKGIDGTSTNSALNVTNSSDNSLLFVRNDGNVGIGTASPSSKLDIGFDVNNRSLVRLNSNAANRMAAITFYGNNLESGTIGYEGGSEIVSGGVQGDLVIRNHLASKNIILITNAGNVGIGTTSPAANLQVNTSSGVAVVAISNGNSITSGSRGDYAWYNSSISTVALIRAAATTDNVGTGLEFYTRPVGGALTKVLDLASTGAATFSTSATTAISVQSTGTASGLQLKNTGVTPADWIIQSDGGVVSGQAALRFYSVTASAYRMSIDGSGNVGIGTTEPPYALSVVRSTGDWIGTYKNYGSGAFGLQIDLSGSTGSTNGFVIGAYSQTGTGFFLKNDGNAGIGTTSPLSKLNIMGTVRINSASAPDANYYLQLENSSSQKAKANAWDTYSDSRIKTNRQPIINAIDKINLLNPIYYNQHDSYVENDLLNIDYNNSYKSLGFIAQEVYEVIPEAVNMGTTNELWAMDYTKLIPILTKAIQEQNLLIKALEQRIINLENK